MEGSRSILWKIIRGIVTVIGIVVIWGILFLLILEDISEGISYDFFLKIVCTLILLKIMNKKTYYDLSTNSEFPMVCLQCGTEYPAGARFCLKCGERLEYKSSMKWHESEQSDSVVSKIKTQDSKALLAGTILILVLIISLAIYGSLLSQSGTEFEINKSVEYEQKTEKIDPIMPSNDYEMKDSNQGKYENMNKNNTMESNEKLLIYSDSEMEYVLWKYEYLSPEGNKEMRLYLNDNSQEDFIAVGLDSPNGVMVKVIIDNYGYNVLYESSIGKSELTDHFFDEFGELDWGYMIQAAVVDFGNDGKKEFVIAIGDGLVNLGVSVFEIEYYHDYFRFKEIGFFEGQEKAYIKENESIILPYGGQGLSTEYLYRYG
ncbi:MAG TPA: zinc ribbon domain-containing protein, partial [Clostridiales bacterium]|nr:zinc ribbon domain-containing protein [Clostridiales bacterium]